MNEEIIKNIPEFFQQFEDQVRKDSRVVLPKPEVIKQVLGKGNTGQRRWDGKTPEQRSLASIKGAEKRRAEREYQEMNRTKLLLAIPNNLLVLLDDYQTRWAYSTKTQAILSCIRFTLQSNNQL